MEKYASDGSSKKCSNNLNQYDCRSSIKVLNKYEIVNVTNSSFSVADSCINVVLKSLCNVLIKRCVARRRPAERKPNTIPVVIPYISRSLSAGIKPVLLS